MYNVVNIVRNCFQETEAYKLQEDKMNKLINDFISTLTRKQYKSFLKVWYEICEMRKIEVDEHIKVANKIFVDIFK